MPTPRDVLNELKWREHALDEAEIHYVHRGAPGDSRVVRGSDVRGLHPSFMELEGRFGATMIPYHRITLIERNGECVWERRAHEDAL